MVFPFLFAKKFSGVTDFSFFHASGGVFLSFDVEDVRTDEVSFVWNNDNSVIFDKTKRQKSGKDSPEDGRPDHVVVDQILRTKMSPEAEKKLMTSREGLKAS